MINKNRTSPATFFIANTTNKFTQKSRNWRDRRSRNLVSELDADRAKGCFPF
jgi:hypothetical protein